MAGGSSSAAFTVTEGGAQGSAYALSITGETTPDVPFAWAGAMVYPGATPFAPADLSSKSDLTFWTQGDGGRYRVMVFCPEMGQIPPEQILRGGTGLAAGQLGDVGVRQLWRRGERSGRALYRWTDAGNFSFQIDEVALE